MVTQAKQKQFDQLKPKKVLKNILVSPKNLALDSLVQEWIDEPKTVTPIPVHNIYDNPFTIPIIKPIPKVKPKPDKPFIGVFDQSMLEEFSEFDKRYRHTYLFITKPGEEQSQLVEYGNNKENTALFYTATGDAEALDLYTDGKVEIKWPDCGFFNYKNTMLFTYRIPDRQWKRGPCQKNLAIESPTKTLYGFGSSCDWGINQLEAAYKAEKTPGILTCIEQMKGASGVVGRALTTDFAVSLPSYTLKGYLLWYKTVPIAIIRPKELVIELRYHYVEQEVKDYNRDSEGNKWTISKL